MKLEHTKPPNFWRKRDHFHQHSTRKKHFLMSIVHNIVAQSMWFCRMLIFTTVCVVYNSYIQHQSFLFVSFPLGPNKSFSISYALSRLVSHPNHNNLIGNDDLILLLFFWSNIFEILFPPVIIRMISMPSYRF